MKTLTYNPNKEIRTVIAALIISLAFLTTAKAQENSSFNAMGSFKNELVLNKTITLNRNFNLSVTEAIEKDNALLIEPWMTTNNYWGTEDEIIESEPALTVESWMSSNHGWAIYNATEILEYDEPLAVEQWMQCDVYWFGSKKCLDFNQEIVENDESLNVEHWMNSAEYWGLNNNVQLASK